MICYLDDDVDQDRLIRLAMARSHRLISPRSLGQSGQHDALHFLYAVSQHTPLMTRNASDFEALHEFAPGAETLYPAPLFLPDISGNLYTISVVLWKDARNPPKKR